MDEEFRHICLEAVRRALDEDLQSSGDITSRALISPGARGRGRMVLREDGVVAGLPLASMVFRLLDTRVKFMPTANDGDHLPAGSEIAVVEGPVLVILEGERTALNFLQRLSGIATLTSRFVAAAAPHGAVIMDTRKTTPGLRSLEKYAVRAGGGKNHRFGLYDAVLIKDNHVAAVGGTGKAVKSAREAVGKDMSIEVEVQRLEDLEEAIQAGADVIMLDNMDPGEVREAVERARGRVRLEASGGINLENVAAYAQTGVDFISAGALTHSARALDIALDLLSE
ncbi:MAG: carboxylating nicotinate-nucleotide diphosphorylase [Actinomycetota bacterium]|nr:carboxylating nicotinate-nucleotide diphosphorylase [Actinomycetota bacterium]MDD5666329.1 carboxylating nicotinate-nucleotide diphosphorylase [Actinomycetota bacterium]